METSKIKILKKEKETKLLKDILKCLHNTLEKVKQANK